MQYCLYRRQMKRSKSMLQTILFGNDDGEDDAKSKNIRQTGTCMYINYTKIYNKIYILLSNLMNMKLLEILVDLREAVLQVARHFINVDPKLNNIVLIADYTMESHAKDHDNYVNVSRTRKRRAKALLGSNIFLLHVNFPITY